MREPRSVWFGCPILPPHSSLLLLPHSPPPPWQGSHAACASTQDVLPEVPGPDGPRKLLLINHQASQSCAQPLSPLNLPRSRCVGLICPVSRTGSSRPGSKSVVPLPQGQEPQSRFLRAPLRWTGDRESSTWSFAPKEGTGTKGYLIYLPARSHHHWTLRPLCSLCKRTPCHRANAWLAL